MKFPVDLLAKVSHEELEQSAERYMKNLLYSDPNAPEYLTVSGSTQAPIDVSSVGIVPLYGFDKQKLLALFTASDRFNAVGLYLLDQWWPVEDILKTADSSRDGAVEVRTVGERIVLYILNRIIYRAWEMSPDELPFLCHGKDDYAKILWKDGEAVGFYSVKRSGSLWKSFSSRRYLLPVMDSIFVRKSKRGKGFGLLMLEDYVQSFEEDSLGLRYPLTKPMYKVCEKFLCQYPGDSDLLWEVEAIGGPRQRTNIADKIKAMDLSAVSKTLFFSEETVKIVETAPTILVMEEFSTQIADVKSTKCSVEIIEEVTILTGSNGEGDTPVVGRGRNSGSRRRKTKEKSQTEPSEKVIRVEDIEAETPNGVQVSVQQTADLLNVSDEVKSTRDLSCEEKGDIIDRSSAEELFRVDELSATEEPVLTTVLSTEETQIQDDMTNFSLITVENVVSESQKTEAEPEAQACMQTESQETVDNTSDLDSASASEDSDGRQSQRMQVRITEVIESETLIRRPLRCSALDEEITSGRRVEVTPIHKRTSQTVIISSDSTDEIKEVTKNMLEEVGELVRNVEAGHGQTTAVIYTEDMNRSSEQNLEEVEEEEPDQADQEKSKAVITNGESGEDGEAINPPTKEDENTETEPKQDTPEETMNQSVEEVQEEGTSIEIDTIEGTSQTQTPEALKSSVEAVAPYEILNEDDSAVPKLQVASVILVDLKTTGYLNTVQPEECCSPKIEENLTVIESRRAADGPAEQKEMCEDFDEQEAKVDSTTEEELSEKHVSDVKETQSTADDKMIEKPVIMETRVHRSGRKSKHESRRKSTSLPQDVSMADISSTNEVEPNVLEGDLAPGSQPTEIVKEISSEADDIPVVETRGRRKSKKLSVTRRLSTRLAGKQGAKDTEEEQPGSSTRRLRRAKAGTYFTPARKYRRSNKVTTDEESAKEDSAAELVDNKGEEIGETNLMDDDNASSANEQITIDPAEEAASEEVSANDDYQPTAADLEPEAKETIQAEEELHNTDVVVAASSSSSSASSSASTPGRKSRRIRTRLQQEKEESGEHTKVTVSDEKKISENKGEEMACGEERTESEVMSQHVEPLDVVIVTQVKMPEEEESAEAEASGHDDTCSEEPGEGTMEIQDDNNKLSEEESISGRETRILRTQRSTSAASRARSKRTHRKAKNTKGDEKEAPPEQTEEEIMSQGQIEDGSEIEAREVEQPETEMEAVQADSVASVSDTELKAVTEQSVTETRADDPPVGESGEDTHNIGVEHAQEGLASKIQEDDQKSEEEATDEEDETVVVTGLRRSSRRSTRASARKKSKRIQRHKALGDKEEERQEQEIETATQQPEEEPAAPEIEQAGAEVGADEAETVTQASIAEPEAVNEQQSVTETCTDQEADPPVGESNEDNQNIGVEHVQEASKIQEEDQKPEEEATDEEDETVVVTGLRRSGRRSTRGSAKRKSKRLKRHKVLGDKEEEKQEQEIEAATQQSEDEHLSEPAAPEIEHVDTEVGADEAETVALVSITEPEAVDEQQSVTETCADQEEETNVDGGSKDTHNTADEKVAVGEETVETQDEGQQAEEENTTVVVETRNLKSRQRSTPTTARRNSRRTQKPRQVEEAQGEEIEDTYNQEIETGSDEAETMITNWDSEDGAEDETTEDDEPVEHTRISRKGRKSKTVNPRRKSRKARKHQPESEEEENSSSFKETKEEEETRAPSEERKDSDSNQKETEVVSQEGQLLDPSEVIEAEVSPAEQEHVEQSVVSETCVVSQDDGSIPRDEEKPSVADTKVFLEDREANTLLDLSEQEDQTTGEESSEDAEPLVEKRVLRKRRGLALTTPRRRSKRISKKHLTEEDKAGEMALSDNTEEEEDETRPKEPESEGEESGEQEGGADSDQVESQVRNTEERNEALTEDSVLPEAALSQSSLSEAHEIHLDGKATIKDILIPSTELESQPVVEAENEEAVLVTRVLRSETKTWLVTPSQSSASETTQDNPTLLLDEETSKNGPNAEIEGASLTEQEAATDEAEGQNVSSMTDSTGDKLDLDEQANQLGEGITEEDVEEVESEAKEGRSDLALDTDEEVGSDDAGQSNQDENMLEDEVEPVVITRRDLRGRTVPAMIITPRSRRSSNRVQKADNALSDEEGSPQSQRRNGRKRRSTEATPAHRAKRRSRV